MEDSMRRQVEPTPAQVINRRQFLQAAAGSALAVSGIAGCGGGGGSNGGGGGNTAARNAAIRDALTAFGALTGTDQAKGQAMVGWFNANPNYADAQAVSDDVIAHTTDGVTVIIVIRRKAQDDEPGAGALSRVTRALTEVPVPLAARVINNFGAQNAASAGLIVNMLRREGYSVTQGVATAQDFANLSGPGVFYIDSHGKYVMENDGRPTYYLMTSDVVDLNDTSAWDAGLLRHDYAVLAEQRTLRQPNGDLRTLVIDPHYAVSDRYCNRFWLANEFGSNSFVFINACDSLKHPVFKDRCIASGASVYAGWDEAVGNDHASKVGPFIVDRMLGANKTYVEAAAPQRPFDFRSADADLANHGLAADPNGVKLHFAEKPGNKLGLLTPSLEFVEVNEYEDKAVLTGVFGKPPASERAVMIGGIEAAVATWDEDKIVCQLPPSGPGSRGDVFVMVRAHKSNVRRITEWNVPMRYEFKHQDNAPLKVSGDVNLRFRADIGEYRSEIHKAPIKPVRAAIATRDSNVDLRGSGERPVGDYCKVMWLGHQTWVPADYGPAPHIFLSRMKLDTQIVEDPVTHNQVRKGAIGLAFGIELPPEPFIYRTECIAYTDQDGNFHPATTDDSHFMVTFGELYGEDTFPSPDPNRPPIPIFAIQIDFGVDFRIPAGVVEDLTDGLVRLEWDAAPPTPGTAPDPQAARSARITDSSQPVHKVVGRRKP